MLKLWVIAQFCGWDMRLRKKEKLEWKKSVQRFKYNDTDLWWTLFTADIFLEAWKWTDLCFYKLKQGNWQILSQTLLAKRNICNKQSIFVPNYKLTDCIRLVTPKLNTNMKHYYYYLQQYSLMQDFFWHFDLQKTECLFFFF